MKQGKWEYKYQKALPVLVTINDLIRLIPASYQWSVEVTDDTGKEVPAIFNIFIQDEDDRVTLRKALKLGQPDEETDDTEHHKYTDDLTIGLIEN